MGKRLFMGSFLWFRCHPPPLGVRDRTAVDLNGGLLGGHGDMLVLDDNALFADR